MQFCPLCVCVWRACLEVQVCGVHVSQFCQMSFLIAPTAHFGSLACLLQRNYDKIYCYHSGHGLITNESRQWRKIIHSTKLEYEY